MICQVKNSAQMPKIIDGCVLTIGVFDGIHAGHKHLIESCKQDAKNRDLSSVIATFDIDPDELFKNNFYKLMSNDQRIKALENNDVDAVVVMNFESLKGIGASEFLDEYLLKLKPASIHVGQNFHFGNNQSGDADLLIKWGQMNDVQIHVHQLLSDDEGVISSSRLRDERKF